MSDINKHKVMQEWVKPFLDWVQPELLNNYLYFETAESMPGIRVLVPHYGDYVNRTDILGFKYKSYSFVFIIYEQVDRGTSDVNVDNMALADRFNDWLELQKELKNFPDFGQKCSEYDIIMLQNMAELGEITEDGLASYMLGARVDYKEE